MRSQRIRTATVTASRIACLAIMLVALALPGIADAQSQRVPPWDIPPVSPPARTEITIGKTPLDVELAVTPVQQALGLGYRNGLAPGTGMLFVSSSASERTFWMKGMRFCLDIVWVQDGQIVGAAERACPDPAGTADADRARFSSSGPVTDVLEVPAGWLQERGYGPGTAVDIPESVRP